MRSPASVGLVALLAAVAVVQAQPPGDRSPPVAPPAPTPAAPDAGPSPPSAPPKDVRPTQPAAGSGAVREPSNPTAGGKPADAAKPAGAGPSEADKRKPQKESGWYTGGIYSFNLLNIEYYDLNTKDLHFSGQRRDIDSDWAGLADLLRTSKGMGFVEIDRKFVNLRNLSAIHDLGGSRGATLTFRDGATLRISTSELRRLIEVTK